jgi:hypothetical protein
MLKSALFFAQFSAFFAGFFVCAGVCKLKYHPLGGDFFTFFILFIFFLLLSLRYTRTLKRKLPELTDIKWTD